MTSVIDQNPYNTIRQLIKNINNAWLNGNPQELKQYFHTNIVITHSDFNRNEKGIEATIQSYEAFYEQAVVESFKDSDYMIEVFTHTAVASYRFEIMYQMNGNRHEEVGREILVLSKSDEQWLAVWRTLIQTV